MIEYLNHFLVRRKSIESIQMHRIIPSSTTVVPQVGSVRSDTTRHFPNKSGRCVKCKEKPNVSPSLHVNVEHLSLEYDIKQTKLCCIFGVITFNHLTMDYSRTVSQVLGQRRLRRLNEMMKRLLINSTLISNEWRRALYLIWYKQTVFFSPDIIFVCSSSDFKVLNI